MNWYYGLHFEGERSPLNPGIRNTITSWLGQNLSFVPAGITYGRIDSLNRFYAEPFQS